MTQEQRTDGQLESPLSQGRSSFPTHPSMPTSDEQRAAGVF
jgi:hypothetical protein